MSEQKQPRNQGDHQRRHRNRGGKRGKQNRGQQSGQHERQSNKDFIPGRDGGGRRRNRRGRSQEQQAPPPKLTWWQKLKRLLGGGPEPQNQKPRAGSGKQGGQPKSNVRNLRGDKDGAGGGGRAARQDRQRPARERVPGNPDEVETPRVHVGNLSYEVTEEELRELFRGVGNVRHVEVAYNRNTYRSKGFGFVEMLHLDEAKQAVEILHDQFFKGRRMTVSGAKPRGSDPREDREEQPRRQQRGEQRERGERSERRERGPRPPRGERKPVEETTTPLLSEDDLEDSAQITTIVETPVTEAVAESPANPENPASPEIQEPAPIPEEQAEPVVE